MFHHISLDCTPLLYHDHFHNAPSYLSATVSLFFFEKQLLFHHITTTTPLLYHDSSTIIPRLFHYFRTIPYFHDNSIVIQSFFHRISTIVPLFLRGFTIFNIILLLCHDSPSQDCAIISAQFHRMSTIIPWNMHAIIIASYHTSTFVPLICHDYFTYFYKFSVATTVSSHISSIFAWWYCAHSAPHNAQRITHNAQRNNPQNQYYASEI